MTAPYSPFVLDDPEEAMRKRIRSSMLGGPSVTDQVFWSLTRAKDELGQRIARLTQPEPKEVPGLNLHDIGNAEVGRSPSFGERLRGTLAGARSVLGSDRFADAVEGFGSVVRPEDGGLAGFLGSAAQAFTASGRRGQERQENAEDRALRRQLLEAQIEARSQPKQTTPARYGAPFWIPDPSRPDTEVQVVQNPTTGAYEPRTLGGHPITRPVRATGTSTPRIDPLSPEGIAASGQRAAVVAKAEQANAPNTALATTRAFAERAENALADLEAIQVPNNTEYEVGRRSPFEAGRSQTYRLWRTTALQFIYPILRKETGAAISNQEFEDAVDLYVPKPGDSETVKAQKRANRVAAVQSLRTMGNQSMETADDNPY